MKRISVLLVFILFTFTVNAQFKQTRQEISGKIEVNKKRPAPNVNVFNLTSGGYTFTDEDGEFKISVKENDELVFSSIQYQQFSVIVTESVLKKGELHINLREGVTQLDEIVIKPRLSGDLDIDVKKLDFQKSDYPKIDIGKLIHGYEGVYAPDQWSAPGRSEIDKNYLQNGLKFVNIFKALFHSKNNSSKSSKNRDISLRQIYNDQFFKKNLGIDEENINGFIDYLQSHGLTEAKLRESNDLQLIQFLVEKSKDYKAQKDRS